MKIESVIKACIIAFLLCIMGNLNAEEGEEYPANIQNYLEIPGNLKLKIEIIGTSLSSNLVDEASLFKIDLADPLKQTNPVLQNRIFFLTENRNRYIGKNLTLPYSFSYTFRGWPEGQTRIGFLVIAESGEYGAYYLDVIIKH